MLRYRCKQEHRALFRSTQTTSSMVHQIKLHQIVELFDYMRAAEIDLYKAPSETRVYFTSSFFTHCVNVVTKRRVAMGVWV